MGMLAFIPKFIHTVNVWLFGFPIIIRYKSGQKVRIRCKIFEGTKNEDGNISHVKWRTNGGQIIYIGIDNVESIYSPVL